MRLLLTCACATACAAPLFAQTTAAPKPGNKPITLSGCVSRSETSPDQYTLADDDAGAVYRLTGTKVSDFLGRRVRVVGDLTSRRFVIAGGFTPSANVAAQAGAMDPSRAATAAAAGAAAPGVAQLPEFRVKSVRPVTGSCPD